MPDLLPDRSSAVDFDWPGWVLAQVGTASTVGFARKAVERVMAEVVPMMAERDRLRAELERLKRDPLGSLHEDKAEIRRLRAAIDATLQTTWTQDEEGGWGTSEDRLHEDRLSALVALVPHWQAWGDGAWHAAGVEQELRAAAEHERDRLRAENERLKTSLALFAERIERDRREPDKILCYVLDMRRVADSPASDEQGARDV